MNILDLNGCQIVVTDVEEALAVTAEYMEYRHIDSSYADFDKRQNAYWKDMHDKLMVLKRQFENS